MNRTPDLPSGSPLVLLVEDHEDSSAMYEQFLSIQGFVVATAPNADDAFAVACDLQPDVVITDIVLPGPSGLQLTERLRRDPRTTGIRIIVLTGRAFPSDAHDAHHAGCDSFLVKPCLPETLAAELRRVLRAGSRTTHEQVFERIRAEYLEMPGMRLKPAQVQRLCGVEAPVCRLVLDALVQTGFLCLKPDGSYARLSDGQGPALSAHEQHAAHSPSFPRN